MVRLSQTRPIPRSPDGDKNDGGFLIISSNICHIQLSLKEVFFEAPCRLGNYVEVDNVAGSMDEGWAVVGSRE